MKLFGSLNNRLMESSPQPTPVVGEGATIIQYSDRRACTITAVYKNAVEVTHDTATRTDSNGMSEQQEYSYEPNPNGPKKVFTKRKDNSWVLKGESMAGGTRLVIGERLEYYDYSF